MWVAASARGRLGVAVDQAPATPFLGREAELGQLQRSYARARDEASVQLVTVSGEPGVGKSRLVRELRAFVDAQPELIAWREGHCLPYGEGISFWALGEVLKAQAGILEFDDPARPRPSWPRRSRPRSRSRPSASGSRPAWRPCSAWPATWGPGGDAGAGGDLHRLAPLPRGGGGQEPLVVVLEDLHWADDALLAFVRHLAEEARGVPLLVWPRPGPSCSTATRTGAGARPTGRRPSSPRPPVGRRHHPPDRGPARPGRCRGWGPRHPAGSHRRQPAVRRGGLPHAGRPGSLERDDRTVRLTAAETVLPDSIQAVIAARLDTLTPELRALLQDAAVVGTVFWSGARAPSPAATRPPPGPASRSWPAGRSSAPSGGSSVAGEAEYAFWHNLTREVAYGQLPRTARVARHRAVAAWIERVAADGTADHAELLAHHYVTALELARAARAARTPRPCTTRPAAS